jgi:CTP synthase (UTP-ammonia lyase)
VFYFIFLLSNLILQHPEFTSRPEQPNPMFLGLLKQIKEQKEGNEVTTKVADSVL